MLFFALPETGEHQNRLANSGIAQISAFVGTSDAEPIGSRLSQYFGDGNSAQAVGVGLDDGKNFPFAAHQPANDPQIVQDRGGGNLRPNRPPFQLDRSTHSVILI